MTNFTSTMRLISILSLFTTTYAFVSIKPNVQVYSNYVESSTSRTLLMAAAATGKKNKKQIPSVPNPFKALPWNVQKEKERNARRMKVESANLHRELGLSEDATFEEITEVTQALIKQAEKNSDIKKKIKVEVAKDRILQIKLNERLAGLATLTEDAKAQSRLEEAEEDDDDLFPEKKSKEWRVPRWAEGLIVKPDAKYRNRQFQVFGLMTLVCFVLPPLAEKVIMTNWMFAAGQIMRRGMSGEPGDDYNPYSGRRSLPHQRTAILLSLFVWLSLKIWTGLIGNIKMVFGPQYVIPMEAALMNLGLGIFTAYTQTYKP